MPRRLNPCSYLPRRLQIVATLTLFVLLCIVFLGTSSTDDYDKYLDKVPYGPKLQEGVHQAIQGAHQVVDHFPNPLGQPAHKPLPEQANSSSGEARWYSDWKWRNPFSSSVTLDEERAVLPPLRNRPRIYTYYDISARRKDPQSRKAEEDLLLLWRRAWWAQGFKPIVLSKAEAVRNPLYRAFVDKDMDKALHNDLMRWLAWGHMGGGILASFMAFPMAPHDDPMLSFLRRGEFPTVTRYEGLGNGLYIGTGEDVDAALKETVRSQALHRVKYIDEAVPDDMIQLDAKQDAIAHYSDSTLKTRYGPISTKLTDPETIGEALEMLPSLINSHLHQTWQNIFSKGISVLKPLPEHTTIMVQPAVRIAMNLTQCPYSPAPASCPPNRPKCKPCVSSSVKINIAKVFRNDSQIFTIGTAPHPYTIQSLVKNNDHLDLKTVRRDTERDIWTIAATKELLGTGISSFARLPSLKDAVASEYGSARSLWLTAEAPFLKDDDVDPEELDWIFGFEFPRVAMPLGKSETPVPGPERRPQPPKPEYGDGPVPTEKDLQNESRLLVRTRRALGEKSAVKVREIVEAWNLADTEAWKFIRAFNARRRVERRQWEDEESSYLGKGLLDRWADKITGDT